jgi:hypothetical protein
MKLTENQKFNIAMIVSIIQLGVSILIYVITCFK